MLYRDSDQVKSCRAAQNGFSTLEVVIGMAVMMVSSLGFLSLTVSTAQLEAENREIAMANAAVRTVIEEIHSMPFREVFARYNTDPADDPSGIGTSPGSYFTVKSSVQDLSGHMKHGYHANAPLENKPIDLNVSIEFPVLGDGTLSETVAPVFAGMPRDFDANGRQEPGDRAQDYKILPFLLTVTWNGVKGPRTISIPRIMTEKKWQKPSEPSSTWGSK